MARYLYFAALKFVEAKDTDPFNSLVVKSVYPAQHARLNGESLELF